MYVSKTKALKAYAAYRAISHTEAIMEYLRFVVGKARKAVSDDTTAKDAAQRTVMRIRVKKKKKVENIVKKQMIEATHGEEQIKDFEYLIHHIETKDGKEEVHHCFLYDHIANLFEQGHLTVKNGKVLLDGKAVKDGTFHVIIGLEKTQEAVYSNKEAEKAKIKPKRLRAGMTHKQKAREW